MTTKQNLRCGKENYYNDQTCITCQKTKGWRFFKKNDVCLQCRNVLAYHRYMNSDPQRMENQRRNAKARYYKKKQMLLEKALKEKENNKESHEEELI